MMVYCARIRELPFSAIQRMEGTFALLPVDDLWELRSRRGRLGSRFFWQRWLMTERHRPGRVPLSRWEVMQHRRYSPFETFETFDRTPVTIRNSSLFERMEAATEGATAYGVRNDMDNEELRTRARKAWGAALPMIEAIARELAQLKGTL